MKFNADVFDELRRLDVRGIARHFGFAPNNGGYIPCPFHHEKTASLKLYPDGRGWCCFGCHKGGDAVKFVQELHGLSALDAAKELDKTFGLGLHFYDGQELSLSEQRQMAEARQKRQERQDLLQEFQEWRDNTVRALNECYRVGWIALKRSDALTATESLAVREMARCEYIADTLTNGSMEDAMCFFVKGGVSHV